MIRKLSLFLLLTLYIVAPAFSAKDAPTITVSPASIVLCNNGTVEVYYTVCPSTWSSGALPAPAAEGWLSVTQPVDATGTGTRYDIGGGNNYGTDLADVPWRTLQPGDAVNIYYRAAPYKEKVLVSETGTVTNPIIINGVTDASGNRPVIDGDGAVTVNHLDWADNLESALFLIHRKRISRGGVFGETANHIAVQNFKFVNAKETFSYTFGGSSFTYPETGRLLWLQSSEYITVSGNIFENAGEGIFGGAPAEKPTKTLTIRGNRFKDLGKLPAGNASHAVYVISYSEPDESNIFEGNYFDDIGDPNVAHLKVRSTGAIIRYNTFEGAARIIDLVEAQDSLVDAIFDNYTPQQINDKYYSAHIYGNLIVNDFDVAGHHGGSPIHIGSDSSPTGDEVFYGEVPANALNQPFNRGVGAPVYFYHNTFHYHSTPAQNWRANIFDPNGNYGDSPFDGQIVAANNIIELTGGNRIGQMRYSGILNWESANLITSLLPSVFAESDTYSNNGNTGDDPLVDIFNNDTRITASASFVNSTNADFLLRDYTLNTGSPALNAATSLPAALSAYPVEYNPVNPATGVMAARSTTNHLGAFE